MNLNIFLGIFYTMMGIEALILIPFLLKFKALDAASKWMCYYIFSSVVFAVGSAITARMGMNNMWLFSMMNFIQFLLLSCFYWTIIKHQTVKQLITYLPILVLGLCIADFLKFEGIQSYNSISAGLKSGIIIAYGVIFFLQLLTDRELLEKAIYINTLPEFWYSSGVFIYFCSSFLFSISYNLIQLPKDAQQTMVLTLLSINYIVGIIAMILLYIGLTKTKRLGYADN
ncbi:hypothetical protein HHL17_18975 [Chitinophaga sp. G-6-1-13]|uniref:Uncharacterized protein n=1 Tax=Chitinophaga fulva TaxID=2728842 RepID=A0A848GNX9_9BACT|nr:hypothetical protein [Chitinophaga fulva]NML39291.1 hypothetical protein [Chitinophaga fulva]